MSDLGPLVLKAGEYLANLEIASGDGYSVVQRAGAVLYPFRHANGNLYFNSNSAGGPISGTEPVLVKRASGPAIVKQASPTKPEGMP